MRARRPSPLLDAVTRSIPRSEFDYLSALSIRAGHAPRLETVWRESDVSMEFGLRDRQVDPKGGALADFTVESDSTTHVLDHLFGNRQADAGALDV